MKSPASQTTEGALTMKDACWKPDRVLDLWEKEYPVIKAILLKELSDLPEVVKDAMQEAHKKITEISSKLSSMEFETDRRLRNYLTKIAKNKAFDYIRKDSRSKEWLEAQKGQISNIVQPSKDPLEILMGKNKEKFRHEIPRYILEILGEVSPSTTALILTRNIFNVQYGRYAYHARHHSTGITL